VVLGVPERPRPVLHRPADAVVIDGVLQVGERIGAVDFPVGAGRVHEDDVQVEVEQVRDRAEDLPGDLVQGFEQEVHRGIRGVLAEAAAAFDRDPLGDPLGAGQLAARLQCPLGDQREQHPLDRLAVQAPAGRDPTDRRADPKSFPDPVQRPSPTQVAGVQHLDVGARGGAHRLLRGQEPRDRRHQPRQGLPVDLLSPTKVVDHLRDRVPGPRVPLVVRQLKVGNHRPVPVRPPRLPQIHAHHSTGQSPLCRATRHKSCAYTKSRTGKPTMPLTCDDAGDQARMCPSSSEVRSVAQARHRCAEQRRKHRRRQQGRRAETAGSSDR